MPAAARHRSRTPWYGRLTRHPLAAVLAVCAVLLGAVAAWTQLRGPAARPTADARPPAASTSPATTAASPLARASHRAAARKATRTPSPHKSASAPAAGGSGCQVAPADSIWRTRVDTLPVASRSAAYVSAIGAGAHVHADFGSGTYDGAPFGIPVTDVPPGTPAAKVSFDYADESDPGPYRIPAGALVEGGVHADGDRHVIAFDRSACRVYELYGAEQESGSSWHAGSGAVFDLRSDRLRPSGWTSADAAGLSIFAGLVRYDDVRTGVIDHALRITVPRTQSAYLWPARHQASSSGDADLPPMGLRLRLKADVDISGLPAQARIVAQALKTYGAMVADNGSAWYVSGTQDDHWNNDALHALGALTGSDFEAVDTSALRISADSGAARRP